MVCRSREYTPTVRAINSYGQQGELATTTFRINVVQTRYLLNWTPGYFQITAVPRLAVYDPTVQFEFKETKIADTSQVETSARYLGTGSQWSVSGPHIKPGRISGFTCAASIWWASLRLWKPAAG